VQLLRQYSCAKKLQSKTVTREKLHKTLSYKKGESKMLMKLTPGVNFINVLMHRFPMHPKSEKKTVKKSSVILYFWDLHVAKSASKMLMKLTPGEPIMTLQKQLHNNPSSVSKHI